MEKNSGVQLFLTELSVLWKFESLLSQKPVIYIYNLKTKTLL